MLSRNDNLSTETMESHAIQLLIALALFWALGIAYFATDGRYTGEWWTSLITPIVVPALWIVENRWTALSCFVFLGLFALILA
jgi:hypothetical protein